MRAAIQGRRFTPHGIEDILGRETRIEVEDSERDSEVDSYHERDRPCPLNLTRQRQTVIR